MTPHPQDPKGEAGSRKTPLHLFPPYAMAQASLAHALGAEKYGAFNWRENGVNATTYVGAMLRHLNAWRDGEDNDSESGVSHLAHVIASANILLDAGHVGTLVDDRSKVAAERSYEGSADVWDGYVRLQVDDLIEEGDEFWDESHERWAPTVLWGTKVTKFGNKYRRNVAEPTTVEGWLRTLPDGYRERALRHCDALSTPCESLPQAIRLLKNWRNSVEGAIFWFDVSQWPQGLRSLPPLPLELPGNLPPLPPVPEGYARWEYRGLGWKADNAVHASFDPIYHDEWCFGIQSPCRANGIPNVEYIEAIK